VHTLKHGELKFSMTYVMQWEWKWEKLQKSKYTLKINCFELKVEISTTCNIIENRDIFYYLKLRNIVSFCFNKNSEQVIGAGSII